MAEGLSRDAFLQAINGSSLREEAVDLEGIGKVLVREITGTQRAQALDALSNAPEEQKGSAFERYQEMVLQHSLVDSAGKPLVDPAAVKDVMGLGASKVAALFEAAERLSGLDAGARERAEKNSQAPSEASTSG